MLFILHHSSFIKTSTKSCSLLHLGEFGSIAHVAGGPPRPVHIPTLGALPVIRREQTFRLLCSRGTNLNSLFLGFFLFLLNTTSIATGSPCEIDISTLRIRAGPITFRRFEVTSTHLRRFGPYKKAE